MKETKLGRKLGLITTVLLALSLSLMTALPVVHAQTAPTVTSVSPNSGTQGQTLTTVIITGTDFTNASAVSFGAGITVNSFTVSTPLS